MCLYIGIDLKEKGKNNGEQNIYHSSYSLLQKMLKLFECSIRPEGDSHKEKLKGLLISNMCPMGMCHIKKTAPATLHNFGNILYILS